MSVDIYAPRVLIPAHREIKPVRRFLRDTFFSQERVYRTEYIDLDSQVQGRRVASFVNKLGAAKVVDRQGFTTDTTSPPCVANKIPITIQDVSTRVMGEHIYEDIGPEARGKILLADDLMTLNDMLERRLEMMCRDAIFTLSGNNSQITAIGDDTEGTFTFPRLPGLQLGTLVSTDAWTHDSSDPLNLFDTWCEIYAKLTGKVVTDIIFGGTAYRTFKGNRLVKTAAVNTTFLDGGVRVAESATPDGSRLVGSMFGGSVRMWTYHEWYDDPDNSGTTTEMVPAKKVMLCSRNLRTEMRYGAVQDLTGDGDNAMPTLTPAVSLPRSWVVKDPPTRWLELRSRPLPMPIENHFMTVQVQA